MINIIVMSKYTFHYSLFTIHFSLFTFHYSLISIQFLTQELTRVRFTVQGDFLRSSCGHYITTGISAFWTHVDDVVGTLNHFHVMFDNQYGVASLNQRVEGR